MTIVDYLRRSASELRAMKWPVVAVAALLFLGGTNAALALSHPPVGDTRTVFVLAAVVRGLALIAISVAALRRATNSPRFAWLPDGGFWLYFGINLLPLAGVVLAGRLLAGMHPGNFALAVQLIGAVLVVPLTPWLVAAAVERPLAWSPAGRFARPGDWLPPLLILSLLILFPLGWLHAWLSEWLVTMAGKPGFVELAVADALVTVLLLLATLALQLTAYRRVAQG